MGSCQAPRAGAATHSQRRQHHLSPWRQEHGMRPLYKWRATATAMVCEVLREEHRG